MADCSKYVIEEKVIAVQKKFFEGVDVIGGIDRGCTLTKVLYSTERDSDYYNLHLALFSNSNFESALDYLKAKGFVQQNEGGKLHVTGAGCDMNRDVIQQKLGLEIQFIDEFLTQSRGTHWLLSSVEDAELCYPLPELDPQEVHDLSNNEMIRNFVEAWRIQVGEWDRSVRFPCLVLFVGSGAGILRLEANGQANMIGGMWLAGKTFLGLAQLLLGTEDYDEIMRLAEAGDRSAADTQVREVLANDPNSPYGKFPPDMPIFSFGKAVDRKIKLSEFKREDIAAALVSMFAINAFNSVMTAAGTTKTPRVYLGGNFFRGELMRREVAQQIAMFGGYDSSLMHVKFVKTGHTGALGAMVSKPEDLQKYMMYLQAKQQQQQQQEQEQRQQQQQQQEQEQQQQQQ